MRNLKKILALVLALVMVVGMMTVASAAVPGTDYKDDASITKFDESIQILTALGIYEGDENAAFNPNNTITRAEVATLVYRVLTGDTAGKYVNIYSDYNQFADVDQNAWYAGYVNFCANAGMLKGDGTNFYPMEKVTGYQVLAIMLRVIGYGQEGEYEGTNWHIRTASKAAELAITKNIVAGTLGAYSTRAMVAEMIYRAIAQAETVSYDRIWLYHGNDTTYAYTHFGLYGKNNTSYEGLTTRELAVVDGQYDEPVATWNCKYGEIEIRFNPKGTWNTYVADDVLFAAAGVSGKYVTLYAYNEDGQAITSVTHPTYDFGKKINWVTAPELNKSADYSTLVYGGTGVVTELFVADGRVFVVEKNTYVDYLKVNPVNGYENLLNTKEYNYGGACYVNTDLPHGSVVIFNMFENGTEMVADNATVHGAKGQNVTVTHTYDKIAVDASYFVAGGTKYIYNSNYNETAGNNLPQIILNRDEKTLVKVVEKANDTRTAFNANQTVYFDDFGNVIFTHNTPVSTSANEKGYVFVRSAAYGGQVADNRWVSSYTVITADGQASTIKGATNTNGYWETQVAASDADFDLGLYAYEVKNGFYALYKVDTTTKSHIVTDTVDYATVFSAPILAGDADAIDSNVIVDDETMFIIANYDKTGMITGYSCVKGFKNIPDLNGNKYIETVWNTEDKVIDLVLVLGAVQSADIVGPASADSIVYLADTTPEDFVNTYDTHKVIVAGQSTTMQFVNNTVYDSNTNTVKYGVGFYTVYSKQFGTNYVMGLTPVATAEGSLRASGVLKVGTELVALAENCTFYQIAGGAAKVITEADLADLKDVNVVVAATDGFGFATVVYVTDIAGR